MKRLDNNFTSEGMQLLIRAVAAISDGVTIYTEQGDNIFTNDAHLVQIGCVDDRETYLNARIDEVLFINPPICSDAVTGKVLKTWQPCAGLVRYYRTGKTCLVSSAPITLDNGQKYIVSIIRDMTELLKLQSQLEKLERRSTQSFGQIDDGVPFEDCDDPTILRIKSKALRDVYEKAGYVSETMASVLILGETGVGKDFLAHYIHDHSSRCNKPFVKVNCGAIPAALLESELFGYVGGAFTGANREGKAGLIESANQGTLFLDEIGEMPTDLQVKLLGVLNDKEITRIGSTKSIPVDFRLISATNADLESLIEQKLFRQDLFYRLNVVSLHIPPLRERPEDILPLVSFFMDGLNVIYRKETYFTPEAKGALMNYYWPGNIRELKNVIERLIVLAPKPCIDIDAVLDNLSPNKNNSKTNAFFSVPTKYDMLTLPQAVAAYERQYIEQALKNHSTLHETARDLGIDISTLVRKKKKYEL